MTHRKLQSAIIVILLSLTIAINSTNNASTYGGTGYGDVIYGQPSWDYGTWCTSSSDGIVAGHCTHWTKGTIDEFREAWSNKRGEVDDKAYDACTNTDINGDGYVIFSSFLRYGSDRFSLYNTDESSNSSNKLNHEHATIGRNTAFYNFFGDRTSDGSMTYQELMDVVINEENTNEIDLAYFCQGMVERKIDEESSGDFTSTSTATVQNGSNTSSIEVNSGNSNSNTPETASIYLQSKDNSSISTTFTINHTVKSHVDHSSDPKWDVKRDDTKVSEGQTSFSPNGELQVNSYTETIDIPLGTQKKVCQSVSHTEKAKFIAHYLERGGIKTLQDTEVEYSGYLDPSTTVCTEAKHPYNFEIIPTQPGNNSPIIYPGEPFSVSGDATVKKHDSTPPETITPSDTVLRLIQFTITPNAPSSVDITGGRSTSDPCGYYQGKLGGYINNCQNIASFDGILQPNSTTPLTDLVNIPDAPIGTKFCTALGVFRADSGDGYTLSNDWNITGANCYTIAKKPNFQVWNGGLYTPGKISTSTTKKIPGSSSGSYNENNARIFGSWDEQLVIANGSISGFASGATLGYGGYGYILPGGHAPIDFDGLSPLTISNDKSEKGNALISSDSSLPGRLISRFATASNNSRLTIEYSDNIKVIDHDYIENPNRNLSNINDLHQTIIIAKKGVEIKPHVKQIDAWIIVEDGYIDTCIGFNTNEPSSTGSCNNQLRINGPVFANQLKLNRTHGAGQGNDSITPAEIFNFRPDAYLWAFARSQEFSEAYTTYMRELAPRF